MIHQLLNLTRKFHLLDTETTGTQPERDRIIELGFETWDATGKLYEWRSYINPGVPIPKRVTEITGISDQTMLGCRLCGRLEIEHPVSSQIGHPAGDTFSCEEFKPIPTFAQVAQRLATGFSDCDFGGKRVRFDLKIVAAEFLRHKVPWSYGSARIVDVDRLEAIAKPRSLSHLYELYTGQKLEGAHGALTDAVASGVVIARQLEAHDVLPRDLDALHQLQWADWVDVDGKFRFVDGVPCFSQWGKHANQPMDSPGPFQKDRRGQTYWDFIITSDFSPDVKRIAERAKLRQFPTQERQV